jgi:dipeptidyl aminopeptidase/acylaminoacyl peptidase
MKQAVFFVRFSISAIVAGTLLLMMIALSARGDDSLEELSQSYSLRTNGKVYRESFRPKWLPEGSRFWYQIKTGEQSKEFVLVNPEKGTVVRSETAKGLGIETTDRLQTSLATPLARRRSRTTGEAAQFSISNQWNEAVDVFWLDPEGTKRQYGTLEPGQQSEFSTYQGHVWLLSDLKGEMLGRFEADSNALDVIVDGRPNQAQGLASPPGQSDNEKPVLKLENPSPNGKWGIRFRKNNVQLVALDATQSNLETTSLTEAGNSEAFFRGPVVWSPDSNFCIVSYVKDAKRREVVAVDSSPHDQLQPKLLRYDYLKPGDELPQVQPVLIDVAGKTATIVNDPLFVNHYTEDGTFQGHWSPSSEEFYFDFNQRGHQLYRILALHSKTKIVRTVVEEQSNTAIEYNEKTWRDWIEATGELLWMSERDGWAHLWLVDVPSGKIKNQITKGEWVVRQVLHVDHASRQVWFLAGGNRPGIDPYYRQLCRVNLDGSDFVCLTEGDGDHRVEFSPDRTFFIDRWSRVDQPTVTELRRSQDGSLVCELERGEINELIDSGWTVPERFVAKGRDGKTDIYGIMIKPSHFDPNKKYPIVEEVYAGPHGSFTPKRFDKLIRQHTLAELGFIVVQSDGMGTDDRGKAFHDVSWKNLEDAGFQDRIAWIKAAAKERPWMDLSRVGIHGGSAGGQNAMRALIDHHDFYHVAVADCGCHDNRMDKIWWNEQWLGWPLDDSYVRSSNVQHASRMKGKLLLIVGELDTNVDPASTMQVVSALQKANKYFEYMPIAGAGHGAAETPYGNMRRMEFLKRHLLPEPHKSE